MQIILITIIIGEGSEFPALTLTVLTRELLTVTEPHLLGVGLDIEQHILEMIVKNNKFGECCLDKGISKKCGLLSCNVQTLSVTMTNTQCY